MSRNNTIKINAAVMILSIAMFLAASAAGSSFWTDVLSPVTAFIAAGILLFSYIKAKSNNITGTSLALLSLACFNWGIADTAWAVLDFSGADPSASEVLWVLYVITNALILLAVFSFIVRQSGKWNRIQKAVDVFTIFLMTIVFIWIVFIEKDALVVDNMLRADFMSLFSIGTDMAIVISVLSWFLSVRSGKIPLFIRIISSGAMLYALTDLLYYYALFHKIHVLESVIYFLYVLALVIIAFGALWMTCKDTGFSPMPPVINEGNRIRYVYLLIFPLLTIVLKALRLISVDIAVIDIATFLILIGLYVFTSKYIQLSVEYYKLLLKERDNNIILEQRVQEQIKELTFLANQDTLTTLFNRRYFLKNLEECVCSRRSNELLAVLLIDMDRFKAINDHFGHDFGDKVLIELSQRLIAWNNHEAIIARLGGDEFAIMLVGKYTQNNIEDFCSEIIGVCNRPINCGGDEFSITISIGIAILSDDACDAGTLMKNADMAMYRAKAQGYNKYQFYNPIMCQDINNKTKIEFMLRRVDFDKEFTLYYQPQFSLPDKKLVGAEALLRWESPGYGYIPPNIFIPVAEETDHILEIGKWVLRKALSQALNWGGMMPFPLRISVNISPKQIRDDKFTGMMEDLFRGVDLKSGWLDAEITESVMLRDTEKVHNLFKMLKKLRISISIDDFGAGYSALGYLSKYPFDRIKIDKSLIDNLSSFNTSSTSVVNAAISMGRSSGIITIAEGVETQEQFDILTELGCNQAQGYLLGRPVPPDVFEKIFLKL